MSAPDTLSAEWLDSLTQAMAAEQEAQTLLLRSQGAVLFTKNRIEKIYQLGPKDQVNTDTGAITRVPADAPPQDPPA
jgi:hypothetical protein